MPMQWPEQTTIAQPAPIAELAVNRTDFVRYRVRPLGDFVNVRGEVKPVYGCSCADSEEFLERVDYLGQQLQEASQEHSFDELMADPLFGHSAKRCLEMHGISLSDVGIRQLQDLLLYEVVDGQLAPGMLVRLNMPRTFAEAEADTLAQLGHDVKQATYDRALAILSTHTGSVEEAIRLTHAMTMQQISTLLSEKADLAKPVDRNASTRDLLKYLDIPEGDLMPVNESML